MERGPPGFRLQRDMESYAYKLEVATRQKVWSLYITKIPIGTWFYFTFTWHENHGLILYENGEIKSKDTEGEVVRRARRFTGTVDKTMVIGKADRLHRMQFYGKFKLGHLAIWTNMLSPKQVRDAYKEVILTPPKYSICCYHLQGKFSIGILT